MRILHRALLLGTLVSAVCGIPEMAYAQSRSLSPERAAAVDAGVRGFAQMVAHDITEEGPSAWRKHFADSPWFFMAVDGHLMYPNGAAAMAGIQEVARSIKHIELRWGDDLRVDPLTTDLAVMASSWHEVMVDATGKRLEETGFFSGTAEYREGRWQFRNAHWSSAVPPEPVH
jgi:hypothetical protein